MTMKRAKKDRPKDGTFEQSRPGLAPRTNHKIIISNSRQKCKPQSGQEGRDFPRVLGIYAYSHWIGLSGEPAFPIY